MDRPTPAASTLPPPAGHAIAGGDLDAVFAAMPDTSALLLDIDAPRFTILAATDEYLVATHTDRSILGRPVFDVFPDANPGNPAPSGVHNLRASLHKVLETGATQRMAIQRYDVRRPDGRWDLRHWSPCNAPVAGGDGRPRWIIHQVRDVTAEVLGREALGRAERHAARTLARMSDAYAILDRHFRFVAMNAAAERACGQPASALVGRSLWEVFPDSLHLEVAEAYRRVVQDGCEQHLLQHYVGDGHDLHLEIDAYPTDEGGIAIFWRDVTARVRALHALRQSDRRKDEFLATLAHELRNPLAPLRSGMQILRRSPGTPVALRALAVMERQLAHMVRLIDDLMDVSRISRGKVELRPERVSLQALVDEALEGSLPLIDALDHRLEVQLPGEPVALRVDRTRIVQVLGNLLNNAAKYTPPGGGLRLDAVRERDDVVIRVSDNGVGIPADQLTDIFGLFTQLGGPGSDRIQGGLGIGLSLARSLVQLHGGRLEAHSEGPGLGATFTVRLPLPPEGHA